MAYFNKIIFFVALFNVHGVYTSNAQTYNGDLILTNQADVDAFAASGYTDFSGNLTIEGSASDLSGLSLTNISGNLLIVNNNNLTSLVGLEGIENMSAVLSIQNNTNLTSLEGLNNLLTITTPPLFSYSGLYIKYNGNLESLDGLENLSTVSEKIEIVGNPYLDDYCALYNAIQYKSDKVNISSNLYNPTLQELKDGFCLPTDTNSNIVGVSELNLLNLVRLTPNPTAGNINLDFGLLENKNLRVLNQLGQVIYQKNNISESIYNFNLDAPEGIYTVELYSDQVRKQFKVIKQ